MLSPLPSSAAPGLRSNKRLRQVSPNTIGTDSAKIPSISSNAAVQPTTPVVMPASAWPAAPPASAPSPSVPVSASSAALVHITIRVPSHTRNVPRPSRRRSRVRTRSASRHASGTIHRVDNPNQPKPMFDIQGENYGQRL